MPIEKIIDPADSGEIPSRLSNYAIIKIACDHREGRKGHVQLGFFSTRWT
jgi:hypothetical protein